MNSLIAGLLSLLIVIWGGALSGFSTITGNDIVILFIGFFCLFFSIWAALNTEDILKKK